MWKLVLKLKEEGLKIDCAPASKGIFGMELAAQVKTIPRSPLQRIFF